MNRSEDVVNLIEEGNIEEAAQVFELVLKQADPDDIYNLAEDLYMLGFSNFAAKAYKSLLIKFPDEDILRAQLADLAVSDGHDDEALEYLSAIKPDSDAYVNSLLVAADLYQTQGLLEVSEHKLLEALQIAPNEEAVIFGLAEFYFNTKKFGKAIESYLALVKMGFTQLAGVSMVQRLGQAYAEVGKFEQALGYFEQLEDEQISPDTRFQIAFTQLQVKNYEDAIESFKKLKKDNKDYTTLYPFLATAYEQLGFLQNALETLQEGLRVDQYNIKLYEKASAVSLKLQQPDEAQVYLEKALELEPDSLTLVIELSNLLVSRQKYQETIDFLSSFVQNDEIDPQIYWNLGKSYNALDNDELALKYYQAARRVYDDNPTFLREFAILNRRVGNLEAARENVALYLELAPDDLEMQDFEDELLEDF
ncbi:MAG: tetratricopeptide repeat protein [Liquorilactobacillus sp.]|uniref:tetratricopeptide repeat protein n=1 Tax=Liquorilactobacillus sp. TaxID=2767923 RepID=UPI0039EB5A1C